jgi:flotillin
LSHETVTDLNLSNTNGILFQIAAEVAAPLSQAKKVTMVASGNGQIGASKLTGEVFDIVVRVPEIVRQMTGVDILKVNRS